MAVPFFDSLGMKKKAHKTKQNNLLPIALDPRSFPFTPHERDIIHIPILKPTSRGKEWLYYNLSTVSLG